MTLNRRAGAYSNSRPYIDRIDRAGMNPCEDRRPAARPGALVGGTSCHLVGSYDGLQIVRHLGDHTLDDSYSASHRHPVENCRDSDNGRVPGSVVYSPHLVVCYVLMGSRIVYWNRLEVRDRVLFSCQPETLSHNSGAYFVQTLFEQVSLSLLRGFENSLYQQPPEMACYAL